MNDYDPKKDCCPRFDPAPWDGKTFEWLEKKFITDRVRCLFNIPLNFGSVMKRLTRQVEKAGATNPDYLCLSDQTSKSQMDAYLAVDRDIPGADNTTLSGKFISKVYEGSFSKTGEWMKDFDTYLKRQGHPNVKKVYQWYTICPKCAKKYGQNYVVLIGRVE